ncbi:MAG TPA: hypothetical protein ENJ40_08355 [Thermosulfurimonas dismutans]|uniref:Uncharacterized protein n=1 Tax=Thermosulfurimonas dismutans TaxID=999894 RepID=A0A7C3CH08_9BACT|nr:hypothetical protein [Thermosulfurimonas dismutans]
MRVSKRYLPLVAGGLWLAVGLGLSLRGLLWIWYRGGPQELLGLLILSLPLALVFSSRILTRTVQRTLNHIRCLPERSSLFSFQPGKQYLLALVMIALGVLLRRLPLPRDYLGGLYLWMGLSLFFSSRFFLKGLSS